MEAEPAVLLLFLLNMHQNEVSAVIYFMEDKEPQY